METAEHLAMTIGLQNRGIQILLWENKTDLLRALLVLRSGLRDFPEKPTVLPTSPVELQRFSIELSEAKACSDSCQRRMLLVPQASTELVGAWLNGWRRQLAVSPGTILVIRRADFNALCRRAPDLMSFAQSDIHEATGLLPLASESTLNQMLPCLPGDWYGALTALPGNMPRSEEGDDWIERLRSASSL